MGHIHLEFHGISVDLTWAWAKLEVWILQSDVWRRNFDIEKDGNVASLNTLCIGTGHLEQGSRSLCCETHNSYLRYPVLVCRIDGRNPAITTWDGAKTL